ncbi:MAG: hypothetical protein ACREND_03145 [Gemmatimonadaceae bacterium]
MGLAALRLRGDTVAPHRPARDASATTQRFILDLDALLAEQHLARRGIDPRTLADAVERLTLAMTAFDAWEFIGRQVAAQLEVAVKRIAALVSAPTGATPDPLVDAAMHQVARAAAIVTKALTALEHAEYVHAATVKVRRRAASRGRVN